MEERKIVREMFDGLFNIVTGPGFYTVDGVKRKKLKAPKSDAQTSPKNTTDNDDSPEKGEKDNRLQSSSTEELDETCDNRQCESDASYGTQVKDDVISACENLCSGDSLPVDHVELDSSKVSADVGSVRFKTGRGKLSPKNKSFSSHKQILSCLDTVSTVQTEEYWDSNSDLRSSPNCNTHNLERDGDPRLRFRSLAIKDPVSVISKSCDKLSVQHSDLVISTRRGKKKSSPSGKCSQETSAGNLSRKDVVPDALNKFFEEAKTISDENLLGDYSLVPVTSIKEADAQSDISTDSRASGYSKSRTGSSGYPNNTGKKSPNKSHGKQVKSSQLDRRSCVRQHSNQSKIGKKRKLDDDTEDNSCGKKQKVDQKKIQRNNAPVPNTSQHKTDKPKSDLLSTTMGLKESRDRKAKQDLFLGVKAASLRNNQRSQQRLKQTKKKQLQTGNRQKVSLARTHLKRSCQKQTKSVSGTKDYLEKTKSTPKQKSRPKPVNKQTASRTQQSRSKHKQKLTEQKILGRQAEKVSRKQDSRAKHKEASGKKQKLAESSEDLLDKQQEILAEHSRQAEKVEECNIISALCQLENKSRKFHSDDLDHIMPMRDFNSAKQNTVFDSRGQGRNHHPGGVWRKLIPEN